MSFRKKLTEDMVLARAKCENLAQVRNLNLWGNDLCDVSLVQRMPNLEVLSLSVNRVESLQAFTGCTKLVELYLRKNEVKDLTEVRHLAGLPNLRVLWLSDNPCASLEHYRAYVLSQLPQLGKLDSKDVAADEQASASAQRDGFGPLVADEPDRRVSQSQELPPALRRGKTDPAMPAPAPRPLGWEDRSRTTDPDDRDDDRPSARGPKWDDSPDRPDRPDRRASDARDDERERRLSSMSDLKDRDVRDARSDRDERDQRTSDRDRESFRESRDSRDFRESRDRDFRDARDVRDSRDSRDVRESRESHPRDRDSARGPGWSPARDDRRDDRRDERVQRSPDWALERRLSADRVDEPRRAWEDDRRERPPALPLRESREASARSREGSLASEPARDNVLCAVLALLRELDGEALELVRLEAERLAR